MKKLVATAVALLSISGAYAQICGEPDTTPDSTTSIALVYNFTASVKTTAGKLGKVTVSKATDCDEAVTDDLCYRKIVSKSVKGYYWGCNTTCPTLDDDASFKTMNLHLTAKGWYDGVLSPDVTWAKVDKFGQKMTDVEVFFSAIDEDADFSATLMGFGKWDTKYGRISSLSGNIQIVLPGPVCEGCDEDTDALAYDICTLAESNTTIAYGSWSMKYNSSASKKLLADKNYMYYLIGIPVPVEEPEETEEPEVL